MNYSDQIAHCKSINELLKIWKNKECKEVTYYEDDKEINITINHKKVFISDGIVDEKGWKKGKKILFVLKEAYGEEEDWSLIEWLRKTGPCSNIWYRIVEWTYGISNTTADRIARYSPNKISFDHGEEPNVWLSQIAVVNLKKSGGKSSSNYSEIAAYAHSDYQEIIREIELIDPDIVVCGATAKSLSDICGDFIGANHCDNWYYYSDVIGGRERLFIDYYHPANRYPALLNYYGLMGIYQQALLEKGGR